MPKFKPETFKAFESMLQSFKRSGYLWGLPGKALGSNRFTFQAPEDGKVYVRILNEADQIVTLTTAVNLGANLDPAIKVRMEYIEGQLTIINPHPADAARAYGNKVSQSAVPPHSGAIGGGIDDYIDSQRFTPGLVTASPVGGMFVRVYAFRYGNVYIPTQDYEIPSGSIPTNPAETVLTEIVYNPTSGLIESYDGSVSTDSTTTYDQDDISAITIPDEVVPLGAITLYNGMTTTLAAQVRVLDAREFLNDTYAYPDFGATETITLAAGVLDLSNVVARNIIVASESGTSDNLIQILGLNVGQEVTLSADSGDTITLINSSDVILYSGADFALSGSSLLKLVSVGGNVVGNYVDQTGGTSGYGSSLTVQDSTGTPSYTNIDTLEFVGGTLTNPSANVARYTPPSGGGGSGATVRTETVLWEVELTSAGTFDTNSADDMGRTGISTLYDDLVIELINAAADVGSGSSTVMAFNNDTTATNYQVYTMYGGSSGGYGFSSNVRGFIDISGDANYKTSARMEVKKYADTAFFKNGYRETVDPRNSGTSFVQIGGTTWRSAAAISRFAAEVNNANPNFQVGTILRVIGVKDEAIGNVVHYSDDATSTPPTQAELVTAFGTASDYPAGTLGLLDVGGAGTDTYQIYSDGTDWGYSAITITIPA